MKNDTKRNLGGWSGLLGSSLLLACNTGVVVGVEGSGGSEGDPTDGIGGVGDPSTEAASDYSQRSQPASWCWFMNSAYHDSILYEVDMVTGEWGARRYLAPHPPAGGSMIALHGRELIWNTTWAMASFNVDTGAFRDSQFGSRGFTSNGEEIVSNCPDSPDLCVFGDLDALWALTPSRTIPTEDMQASVFALGDDVLYGAWHASTTVDAYDKQTGEVLKTISLSGLGDTAIHGLDVVGDRLLRLDDARYNGEAGAKISIHDLTTGANTANMFLGPATAWNGDVTPEGLVCGGTFD